MHWFLKNIAFVSCLCVVACGGGKEIIPQPEAPKPFILKGKTYTPEEGKTVVEPDGPWYGFADACRVLDSWKFGYIAAQKAGYESTLEDGQLLGQIGNTSGNPSLCQKVAGSTMALRYSVSFLNIVLEYAFIPPPVTDGMVERQGANMPSSAFSAWKMAEKGCDKGNKLCLEDIFKEALSRHQPE